MRLSALAMRLSAFTASLMALGSLGYAQTLPSGCDCYVTDAPPMGDSTIEIPALPLGFFGTVLGAPSDALGIATVPVRGLPLPTAVVAALCPGSAIFTTVWVDQHGTPVAPNDVHRVGSSEIFTGFEPIDTIICRPGATVLPGAGGSTPVAIELRELSLQSVSPISVTYGGGAVRFWDVFVTEDGVAPAGAMTVSTTSVLPGLTSGTMAMSSLPVDYLISFVETTGSISSPTPLVGSLDFTNPTPGNFAFAQAVAPANDECNTATAAVLGINSYDATGATDSAETIAGATCGVTTIFQDVWFTFNPPTTDLYDFETIDNGSGPYDTKLVLYNTLACPADELNIIDCVDDGGGPGFLSLLEDVPLTAGVPVLVRVGAFSAATVTGPLDLSITVAVPPPGPPANDECANAIAVMVGLTAFDQTSATDSVDSIAGATCGITTIFQDIWFTFTAPTTDVYDFESLDAGFGNTDTKFALYSSTACPADELNLIDCDDDGGATAFHSMISASLTAGQTVLLRVGTFGATSTTLPTDLSISVFVPPVPPANDDCANATAITMFGTYAYDTTNATTDGLDLNGFCDMGTFGDEDIHNDVWFEYTPAVGGCTYISTLGLAAYDTRLAVYTGATCPNDPASVLACNDDEVQPIAGPFEAGIDVTLSAGTTYLIRLGNFGVADPGGAASVLISAGPLADANNTTGTPQVGAPGCGVGPAFNEFCFGDGGDQMGCTNCPCGNNAPIGSGGGCLNSGGNGTRLNPSGDTSVSLPSGDNTDLRFGADGAPPLAFCILNSGDAVAPGNMANPCFGMNSGAQAAAFDGLRCAITNTRRHGGRSADANGDVGVTNNPWGGEGGPPVGIAVAGGGFAAGQTRFFQIINRDDPLVVCMRALNTSQAVEVTFTP